MSDSKSLDRLDPLDAALLREKTLQVRLFEAETEKVEAQARALRLEAEHLERQGQQRRVALVAKAKELKEAGAAMGEKYGCGWRDFNIDTGAITRLPDPAAPALPEGKGNGPAC